jgi:hypothetical protein
MPVANPAGQGGVGDMPGPDVRRKKLVSGVLLFPVECLSHTMTFAAPPMHNTIQYTAMVQILAYRNTVLVWRHHGLDLECQL